MSEEKQQAVNNMLSRIRQERDDLKVRMHLAKREFQDEWDVLEEKFVQFNDRLGPARKATAESAGHVWESLKLLGEELSDGYRRIRKSL